MVRGLLQWELCEVGDFIFSLSIRDKVQANHGLYKEVSEVHEVDPSGLGTCLWYSFVL